MACPLHIPSDHALVQNPRLMTMIKDLDKALILKIINKKQFYI